MIQYDVVLTLFGIAIALINLILLRYVSRKRADEQSPASAGNGKVDGGLYVRFADD